MSRWLEALPHQIPFRAASSARRIDDRTIEGDFLCTANDALTEGAVLAPFVVEAMAQIAGSLVFDDSAAPAFLSAIDEARVDVLPQPGDRLLLRATLDADFGGVFRFSGTASREGLECARARFYLAKQ